MRPEDEIGSARLGGRFELIAIVHEIPLRTDAILYIKIYRRMFCFIISIEMLRYARRCYQ